ncbi:hypothetical protein VZT92_007593 [Zoarces viviparus]|uniref:Uncharacterized protein n=1 Tax=Zoarces viviparus TaxID=48416 RepID=A0AAW1FKF6_ZOAVI
MLEGLELSSGSDILKPWVVVKSRADSSVKAVLVQRPMSPEGRVALGPLHSLRTGNNTADSHAEESNVM